MREASLVASCLAVFVGPFRGFALAQLSERLRFAFRVHVNLRVEPM